MKQDKDMTRIQMEKLLELDDEIIAKVTETLDRLKAEPEPRRPYYQERINYTQKMLEEMKERRSSLLELMQSKK